MGACACKTVPCGSSAELVLSDDQDDDDWRGERNSSRDDGRRTGGASSTHDDSRADRTSTQAPEETDVDLESFAESSPSAGGSIGGRVASSFDLGAGYEAWYHGSWYPVELVERYSDKAKIRWDYNRRESEVWLEWVRRASLAEDAPATPRHLFEVGDNVEARYGSGWFDAMIVEDVGARGNEGNWKKIRWSFDGSETVVAVDSGDIRPKRTLPPHRKGLPGGALKYRPVLTDSVLEEPERHMEAENVRRVQRWLPQDAPAEVQQYIGQLLHDPTPTFGGAARLDDGGGGGSLDEGGWAASGWSAGSIH